MLALTFDELQFVLSKTVQRLPHPKLGRLAARCSAPRGSTLGLSHRTTMHPDFGLGKRCHDETFRLAMKHALTFDAALLDRATAVKLLLLDVDGVLTDGGLYFGADGEQLKRFHTLDGHGIKMLQSAGVAVGIISGRDSAALRARMQALGVTRLALGVADKLAPANTMLAQLGLTWQQTAAMGDDWPDLPLLRHSAVAFAPVNAHAEVLAVAHHVTTAAGGAGAVREVCDLLLQAHGKYAQSLSNGGLHA